MVIEGLSKEEVLRALYNNATRAIGYANELGMYNMSDIEAGEVLLAYPSCKFTYLRGRVLKVNLSSVIVDTYFYNQANGLGKAERVIADLRAFKAAELVEENRIT